MVMIPPANQAPRRTGIPLIDARLTSPLAPSAPIPTQMPVPPPPIASDPNPALTAFFAGMQPATSANSVWPSNAASGPTMPGNLFVNPTQPGSFFIKSNSDNGFWSFDPTNKVSAAPIKVAPAPQPTALPPVNLPATPALPPVTSLPPVSSGNLPPISPPGGPLPPLPAPAAAPSAPPPIAMPAPPAMSAPPFDPLAALTALQSQAAPPPMADPIAGDPPSTSPLAPPSLPVPSAPNVAPGTITQPPPTQTIGQSVNGAPAAAAGSPGLGAAPDAGAPAGGAAPMLAPPTDEGPQAIPFVPNNPTPPASTLSPTGSVEDFLGNFGGLQFGAEGILGVPGGPQRGAGQSEADFVRTLITQGLLRGVRPRTL